MARLTNKNLELIQKTATRAKFRITFKIKQNQHEQNATALAWDVQYQFYAVDPHGARTAIPYPYIQRFSSTNEQYIECEIVTFVDRALLDEDPFYEFWKNTEDEICAKLILSEITFGIYGDEGETNWIREQFGWF